MDGLATLDFLLRYRISKQCKRPGAFLIERLFGIAPGVAYDPHTLGQYINSAVQMTMDPEVNNVGMMFEKLSKREAYAATRTSES